MEYNLIFLLNTKQRTRNIRGKSMRNKLMIGVFLSIFLLLVPNVKAVNFTDNQIVDVNKTWTIKFTDEVGFDNLTKQGITVTDSNGAKVNVGIQLGEDAKTIVVTAPEGGYTKGERYTLTVGKSVHNKNGKQMKQDRTINFNIESNTTSPSLTIMTDANYDDSSHLYFSEGLVAMHDTDGFSYVDTNGKVKIGPIKNKVFKCNNGFGGISNYEEEVRYVSDFHEGLAFLREGPGVQIIIDNEGNEVFQSGGIVTDYEMKDYVDGLSVAVDPILYASRVYLLDKIGNKAELDIKTIAGDNYWGIGDYAEGLLAYVISTTGQADMDNGKYGYIDIKSEKIAIKPQFEDCRKFNKGIAPVKLNGKWGFIDREGNFIINPQYEDFWVKDIHYSYQVFNEDNIASVKKNGKWGVIDKSGKVIVDFKYDNGIVFNDGVAAVEENGKYGYIDMNGKEIIEPQYDDANIFNKDIALVSKNGNYYLIDKGNKRVSSETWNFQSTFITDLNPDIVFYKQNGKWGMAKITY